mmetsp:Transcript_2034/g.4689  ORF Transcript_2034/g.4689 Transcript_2034/m.4689 type:complete len:128 (-) Transcript_2034:193-576(-)
MRLSSRRLSVLSATAAAAAVMLGLTATDAFVVVGPRQHHNAATVSNNIIPSSILMASTEESSSPPPCAIPSDLSGDDGGDTPKVTVADLRSASLVNQRNERVSLGDLMGSGSDDDKTSIVVFLRHMG